MRILIFHGYLLRGTGSNIYNASLARALVALGHEVHLVCQDHDAARLPFVDAVVRVGAAGIEAPARDAARCTVYLPDIGEVLPVYVADRYEGFRAVRFADLSDSELTHYIDANVAAVRVVVERVDPDVALANHLVMGPVILARALGGRVPYAVKVHGSALEYTVRPGRERFSSYAAEGLAPARAVLVGSRHTAESLIDVMAEPELEAKVRLGPPGVDTRTFRPRPPGEDAAALEQLASRVEQATAGWGGDSAAAAVLRTLDPERDLIVTYVGKLIVSKGVDLLIAAWPLVAARIPNARLCVVGFGTYREPLEGLAAALAGGELAAAREIARRGRELEGGPAGRLRYLDEFLAAVERGAGPEPAGVYLRAAAEAFERVGFVGRLEHDELPPLLASALVQVVPSTFPESFGMVAVEAAACGALPLSARHSGLAEVTQTLEPALAAGSRHLLSFDLGDDAVVAIAGRLVEWLSLSAGARDDARAALSDTARGLYGWEGVAQGVIAAAQGRFDELRRPA